MLQHDTTKYTTRAMYIVDKERLRDVTWRYVVFRKIECHFTNSVDAYFIGPVRSCNTKSRLRRILIIVNGFYMTQWCLSGFSALAHHDTTRHVYIVLCSWFCPNKNVKAFLDMAQPRGRRGQTPSYTPNLRFLYRAVTCNPNVAINMWRLSPNFHPCYG